MSSLGSGDEGHAERQHLLLAAGQVGRRLLAAGAEDREVLERPGPRRPRSPPGRPAGAASRPGAGSRPRSATGRPRRRPGTCDDAPGRDLVRRGVGDVAPVEDDRAAVGLDHAADGPQQRRLAGPVGAEEGDDLALVAPRCRRRRGPARRRSRRRGRGRCRSIGLPWRRSYRSSDRAAATRHTWRMSSPMRFPAEAMIKPADEEDRGHHQHARCGCPSCRRWPRSAGARSGRAGPTARRSRTRATGSGAGWPATAWPGCPGPRMASAGGDQRVGGDGHHDVRGQGEDGGQDRRGQGRSRTGTSGSDRGRSGRTWWPRGPR